MRKKGIVLDIQRFSLHDGPGIRTTVFLKGCPLRCMWCHNPESWLMAPQSASVKGATKILGKEMSVFEVFSEVEADMAYYKNSSGGLTISGGEPLFQFEFTYELLKLAKEKHIHTCIETSGYAAQEKYEKILDLTDLFLFDIKATGTEMHKELTNVDNEIIMANLDFIYNKGASIILRCPFVKGVNDSMQHIKAIVELAEKYPHIKQIKILPYHDFGKGKWEEIGIVYKLKDLKTTDDATKLYWMKLFKEIGCNKVTI